MSSYAKKIASARLLRDVESAASTGDLEYAGTALEVCDPAGVELFHVVVDESGEQQIFFFASERDYRIPLDLLERILVRAKEVVRQVDL